MLFGCELLVLAKEVMGHPLFYRLRLAKVDFSLFGTKALKCFAGEFENFNALALCRRFIPNHFRSQNGLSNAAFLPCILATTLRFSGGKRF
jgi:hypothetical protein